MQKTDMITEIDVIAGELVDLADEMEVACGNSNIHFLIDSIFGYAEDLTEIFNELCYLEQQKNPISAQII